MTTKVLTACLSIVYLLLLSVWMHLNILSACIALIYSTFSILMPGFLISTPLTIKQKTPTHPNFSTSIIFGFSLILLAYFMNILFRNPLYLYSVFIPYLLLVFPSVRRAASASIEGMTDMFKQTSNNLVMASCIALCLFVTFALGYYPTPGVTTIVQDHHPLMHATIMTGLKETFPFVYHGMSAEPVGLGYNSFLQIIGVHFSAITNVSSYMFIIKYGYLILAPALFISFIAFFKTMGLQGRYLLYAMLIIFFGSDYLVNTYCIKFYQPQMLGILLFINILSLMVLKESRDRSSLIAAYILGPFLLVSGRLPGAMCLLGGFMLYNLVARYRFQKSIQWWPIACLIISAGISWYIFFKWNAIPMTSLETRFGHVYNLFGLGRRIFPILAYFEKFLMSTGINDIIRGISMSLASLIFFPVFLVLHLSYSLFTALPVIKKIVDRTITDCGLFLFACMALFSYSLLIVMDILGAGETFFLDFGFLAMLLLFAVVVAKTDLFENISATLRMGPKLFNPTECLEDGIQARKLTAWLWIVILLVPYLHLIQSNVGLNPILWTFKNATYSGHLSAANKNILTVDLYDAFSFIRLNAPADRIIVAADVVLPVEDESTDPRSQWVTGLSERTAYVQSSYNIFKNKKEQERRFKCLHDLQEGTLCDELKSSNYLFLLNDDTRKKLMQTYSMKVLYSNKTWCVAELANNSKSP